jgi:hypothetical protein
MSQWEIPEDVLTAAVGSRLVGQLQNEVLDDYCIPPHTQSPCVLISGWSFTGKTKGIYVGTLH